MFLNSSLQKAAEFSGVAGEFRGYSCVAHKSLRICDRCRLGAQFLIVRTVKDQEFLVVVSRISAEG